MKLNSDILYWRLKEQLHSVVLHGRSSDNLALSRPEFYLDRAQTFEKNRVYVCAADHLPQRPELSGNVCLIVLGQHGILNAYDDRWRVSEV